MNAQEIIATNKTCRKCMGTGRRLDVTSHDCKEGSWNPGRCSISDERVRKNGTCSYHACYWCDGNGTLTPRESFMQWINANVESIDDEYARNDNQNKMREQLSELLNTIITEGPKVSRAARWQSAVSWFGSAKEQYVLQDARWIITQGTVYLSHGSD